MTFSEITGQPWDVVIIGGGPAGIFAAIRCAELANSRSAPLRVLVLERSRRPLGKVLISGGGRCNVTHACFEPAQLVGYYPRGGAALRGAFSRFQPRDTVQWFEKRGVTLKTEADGRMFPVTDNSETIANCLLDAARRERVVLWPETALQRAETLPNAPDSSPRFRLGLWRANLEREEALTARNLLFATGSDSFAHGLIASFGHKLSSPVPSLFTFNIVDKRLSDLAGVSVTSAALRLVTGSASEKISIPPQQGPLLITHWGLSGPAALRLSAWGARWLRERQYRAGLLVNWLNLVTTEKALETLQQHKNLPENARKKPAAQAVFPQIPIRLWKRLVEAAGIAENQNWADISKPSLRRLAEELTAGRYEISGKGQFKDEFVTCGGVCLDEVDFKTMQSRLAPGLYFAGEVLDIDGLTGGFNFQNAWTTGWLAGSALGQ